MAKGKKFNAAEKHFEEKCVVWRQRVRELEHENIELRRSNIVLSDKNIELSNEITKVKAEMNILMELKEMSPEDVKTLITAKRRTNEMADIFNVMGRGLRGSY